MPDRDSKAGVKSPEGPDTDDTVRFSWDESVDPCVAVVEALAVAAGRDPTDIAPLYEYLDVDALDTLVKSGPDHGDSDIEITFTHGEFTITVNSSGCIEVAPVW